MTLRMIHANSVEIFWLSENDEISPKNSMIGNRRVGNLNKYVLIQVRLFQLLSKPVR